MRNEPVLWDFAAGLLEKRECESRRKGVHLFFSLQVDLEENVTAKCLPSCIRQGTLRPDCPIRIPSYLFVQ